VLGLQARPGFEVSLASGPTTGAEGSLEKSFLGQEHLLLSVPHLIRPVRPISDLLAYLELRRLFRLQRSDIVHTHSGKAGILGRLAAAHSGVRTIIHTVHGPSFGDFQGRIPNLVFTEAERTAARVTTHFVTVADAMKHQYLASGIGRPAQYTTIYSGFDIEPYLSVQNSLELRASLGLRPEDIVVGKIARLFELKGHEDLFTIAPTLVRKCPDLKFLLVGDGPSRCRFETRVRDLGVAKHFVFTGLVPPSQVPNMVGIMDLLVHLSRREGLARALPQALAAEVPVIAYDCDGAGEVCLHERTGLLINPGNLQSLAAGILRLAQAPALRLEYGNCGRKQVQNRFRVETMVDRLARLYIELAATSSLRTAQPSGHTDQ
jgi:glycosyltransferase involved in cell wall biosynthesis